MTSILTIASNIAAEIQVPAPGAVYGSTDPTARRMLRYISKAGENVARQGMWTALRSEHTFTSTATYIQVGGKPDDFSRIVPDSVWDRTNQEQIAGPVSSLEWQRLVAEANETRRYFALRGSDFLLYPAPTSTITVAYDYISVNWLESSGGAAKSAITADTDVTRIDAELVTLAAIADWLAAEGQPHQAVLREYKMRLQMLAEQDHPINPPYASDLISEGSGFVGFPRSWSSGF